MPLNVQAGRWMDGLRQRLGVQGHTGLNLVDDCLPTFSLTDRSPESFHLREEARYSQWANFAASVGNVDRFTLYPNVLQSKMVIIEHISSTIAVVFGWGVGAAVGAVGAAARWDSRQRTVPGMQFGIDQPAASGLVTVLGQLAPNTERDLGIVMVPRDVAALALQFIVATKATNVAADIFVEWREYVPTDEEVRSG